MIERTCRHCGALFSVYPSVIRKGGGTYCSRSCGAKGRVPYERTAEHRAKMSASLVGKTPVLHAIEAAAAARRGKPPSERNRAVHSELWSGETNPRWNGGVSYERYSPGYWKRRLRLSVIARDRVCQDCGTWDERPRMMHVHHLDGKRTNHELANLVLLCNGCHRARHRKNR